MKQHSFSAHDLLRLANAAGTLYERLDSRPAGQASAGDDPAGERWLEQWCQAVTGGDRQLFLKRLAWDGYDLQSIRRPLAADIYTDPATLPAWTVTLDRCLRFIAQECLPDDSIAYRFLRPDDPVPFEAILAPFVAWAHSQLLERTGPLEPLLSDGAQAAFEFALLETLFICAAGTLHLEFSIERANQQSVLSLLVNQALSGGNDAFYRQFVEEFLDGRFVEFFKEYPMLARMVATLTDLWIDTVAEFVVRLASDRAAIGTQFNQGQDPGRVSEVQIGLSDRHNGGRSVLILTFSSGLKLVYKPKDLTLDETFYQLLHWYNRHDTALPLGTLRILNRGSHGWAEFVAHLPCTDQAGAGRYFQRAGKLACLVYALAGNDSHYENIIASGEHPFLIDLETLFHPNVPSEDERVGMQAARMLANRQLRNSVLRTGFLPRWVSGPNGESYDVSGLGGLAEQATSFQKAIWRNINTDTMDIEYASNTIKPQANLPLLNGQPLNPDDYLADFVAGFTQMYRFLLEHREALLSSPDSPFPRFDGQPVRFLVRSTRVYGMLLQKLLQPTYLRHGLAYSFVADAVCRGYLSLRERPPGWPLVRAEHRALAQLDIPYFTATTASRSLQIATGATIHDYFDEPGFERAVAHIRSFDETDLDLQVRLIQESFYARMVDPELAPDEAASPLSPEQDGPAPLTDEQLVHEAIALAEAIRARAVRASDGSATWIAPEYNHRIDRYQLQPLGYTLYGGTPGIGLFLAALEQYTGGLGYAELALGTVEHIRRLLRTEREETIGRLEIGGVAGIGSIAYTLLRMADLLAEPALLEDARLAAALISTERIAADQSYDIIAGAAGALLALLALHERTGDDLLLRQAIACGEHLLDARVAGPTGYLAWATLKGIPLTGFSHGAAGIAYALLKLYAATADPRFLAAAVEGMNYERSVFSPQAGNWPDFRISTPAAPRYTTSWCHGATGIGLARLATLHILDTPEIHAEIAVALATTQRAGTRTVDHLCCGNAGRIDLFLCAGRQLTQPALVDLGREWMARIVHRAQLRNSYYLMASVPSAIASPGLFQGLAGIGYELLRLAGRQTTLPSVLLLE